MVKGVVEKSSSHNAAAAALVNCRGEDEGDFRNAHS
jgi:hypothetical protein